MRKYQRLLTFDKSSEHMFRSIKKLFRTARFRSNMKKMLFLILRRPRLILRHSVRELEVFVVVIGP